MNVHIPPRAAELGLIVMWSSGFIGAALGTTEASALTLLGWRYLVAMALVAVAAALWRWLPRGREASEARRRRCPRSPGASARCAWPRIVAVGLLTQAAYLGGVVGGVSMGVPAGTAALIAALQPLTVAVLGSLLGSEHATPRTVLGLVLGLVGVAAVVAGDLGASRAPVTAFALPLAGMAALSVGTVLDRRWRLDQPLPRVLGIQTVGAGGLLVATAAATGQLAPPADPDFWFAVVWVVALSTAGGYGFYFLVLRRSGPTRVSVLLYLTPPATALWGMAQLGEVPGLLAAPGAVLCAVAVTLAGRSDRPVSRARGARRPARQRGRPPQPHPASSGCR